MISIDISGFEDEPKRIEDMITVVMQKVTFDGFSKIIQESPRDTGLFVSSWMIDQIGQEDRPNATITSGEDAAARSTAITRLNGVFSFELGTDFHFYNNTEYGVYINYGQPKRMVTSMIEGNAWVMDDKLREVFNQIL